MLNIMVNVKDKYNLGIIYYFYLHLLHIFFLCNHLYKIMFYNLGKFIKKKMYKTVNCKFILSYKMIKITKYVVLYSKKQLTKFFNMFSIFYEKNFFFKKSL